MEERNIQTWWMDCSPVKMKEIHIRTGGSPLQQAEEMSIMDPRDLAVD